MTRRILLVVLACLAAVAVAGLTAVGSSAPQLSASGETAVTDTAASVPFTLGDRTVVQVRYRDRKTMTYSFDLTNAGANPVHISGLAPPAVDPRLFDLVSLVDERGEPSFDLPAGSTARVHLRLRMTGCETLSARAGSFLSDIRLRTSVLWGLHHSTVTVPLPEELRTGSPREAGCANATATSRPPG